MTKPSAVRPDPVVEGVRNVEPVEAVESHPGWVVELPFRAGPSVTAESGRPRPDEGRDDPRRRNFTDTVSGLLEAAPEGVDIDERDDRAVDLVVRGPVRPGSHRVPAPVPRLDVAFLGRSASPSLPGGALQDEGRRR